MLSYFYLVIFMVYIKNLFISLKEVILIMLFQYFILISTILIFGFNKSIVIGSIILLIFQIIYIAYKIKDYKFSFNNKIYFKYILLGISITVIYNMTIFKIGIKFDINNDIPFLFKFICSSIIGPIFEEILFRYSLINKLLKFNNKKVSIILGGIIFSLCHNNIITIIYAFIIGLINSYIYIESKDIIIPIIIHISLNSFSLLLFDYNHIILLLGILLFLISILCIKKSIFMKK